MIRNRPSGLYRSRQIYPDVSVVDSEKIYRKLRICSSPSIPKTSMFSNLPGNLPLILHVGVIGRLNGTFEAAACVLYWAVKSYPNYTITNGIGIENSSPVHSSSSKTVRFGQEEDISLDTPELYKFNTSSSEAAKLRPCNFTIDWRAHRALQNSLSRFMSGHLTSWYVDKDRSNNTLLESDDEETDILY